MALEISQGGILPVKKETERRPEQATYNQAFWVYLAWHAAEGKKRDIIDFDLSGPHPFVSEYSQLTINPPVQAERKMIVQRLENLHTVLMSHRPSNQQEAHNWAFLTAQVRASTYYARLRAGEEIKFDELIEKTLGTYPTETPPEVLSQQQEIVTNSLKDLELEPDNFSINEWRINNQLSREEARERLKKSAVKTIKRVGKFIGENIDTSFEVIPQDEDRYYWVWADTNGNGDFVLKQNFSEKRGKIWTRGKIQELKWHEGGEHISRMAIRKKLIKDGKLHPIFGLTTVHGPEPVVEEGLAVTMTYFVPGAYENLSPEGRFQVEATILKHMVYGNVHIRLNRENPPSTEEVISYVQSYLPWEARSEIEEQIKERTQNPLYRIYLYSYAIGTWMHAVFARTLNDRGKREFLKEIMSRPYTPTQEIKLWQDVIRDRRNKSVNTEEIRKFLPASFTYNIV